MNAHRDTAQLHALQAGYLLNSKYTLLKLLGRGTFSITYLARNEDTQERVVIKENAPSPFAIRPEGEADILPHPRVERAEEALDWALRDFLHESETLVQLRHPAIIEAHEVFRRNRTAYCVMSYRPGGTLADYLKQGFHPSPHEAELLLRHLLSALHYLHTHQLLHRDIKPSNILMTPEGPVLIDFGNARLLTCKRTHLTAPGAGYAPLEQVEELGSGGPRSDIYSLGATMYELLTGNRPPHVLERTDTTQEPRIISLEESLIGYQRTFLRSIDKALAVYPEDRWQSVSDWQEALEEHEDTAPPRPQYRTPLMIALGIAVLFFGGVVPTVFRMINEHAQAKAEAEALRTEQERTSRFRETLSNAELLDQALLQTAAEGLTHEVRELLEHSHAHIACRDENGLTPLHRAVASGHGEVAGLLLRAGAPIMAGDVFLNTPLHTAAAAGQTEMVRLLLDHGANKQARNLKNHDALYVAAEAGQAETVKLLPDTQRGSAEWFSVPSPLHAAAAGNHPITVEALLDQGIAAGIWDPLGATPLMYAAYYGREAIVSRLLQVNANPNHRSDLTGLTCADFALAGGHPNVLTVLKQAGMHDAGNINPNTALLVTAAMGDEGTLLRLLRDGADVSATSPLGVSALHMAAAFGHEACAWHLLQRGADLQATTQAGLTPLHLAAQCGQAPMVQMLLKEHANPDALTHEGELALHLAAKCGHLPTLQLLIHHTHTLDIRTRSGKTPLAIAAAYGHYTAVKLMLQSGASVTVPEGSDYSPLHQASWGGHTEIVRLLLEHRAGINKQDSVGHTPLYNAVFCSRRATVELLLNRGADPTICPPQEGSLLHVAARHGATDIMKILLERGMSTDLRDAQDRTARDVAAEDVSPGTSRDEVATKVRSLLNSYTKTAPQRPL